MSLRNVLIGRRPARSIRAAPRGFTLIELLVALTLAALISVTIMVISNTAREIYDATTEKVELSNRFRLALLTMDRDFSQWINTSNLEFFADGRGSTARLNKQWDEGEELPDTRDDLGKGVVDGGIYGQYEEFASITERHYVGVGLGLDPSDPDNARIHDAYQAYFRSFTYIDGKVREANIEYMLLDPNRTDPLGNPLPPVAVQGEKMADLVLVKVVRYHDINPRELLQVAENFPITRRRVEVASNVTDFKIEYYLENPYNPRVEGGFMTPGREFEDPVELATRPERIPSPKTNPPFSQYRKVFGYGSNNVRIRYPRATAFKARQGDREPKGEHFPVRFGFLSAREIQFAELTQGDKIFIFTEANRGSIVGGAQTTGRFVKFASREYTVKSNVSGLLQFYEPIDSATWQGDQSPLLYKAAFLPAAVRITLRVVDDKGGNPKTLQREIWIRRRAR